MNLEVGFRGRREGRKWWGVKKWQEGLKKIWVTRMGGEGREEERKLQEYERHEIKNRESGTMIQDIKVIGDIWWLGGG